jgi:plasmid stabilization system protein ParE
MTYKLIIKADAYEDIAEAFEYNEQQVRGLGDRFWNELQSCFSKIEKNPTHYGYSDELPGMIFRDVRMEKFPYKIYFEVIGFEVVILAVFHGHRNPDYIKKRLD